MTNDLIIEHNLHELQHGANYLSTPRESLAVDKNEVVVSVKGVSKKFCRTLRRSMAYGIIDMTKGMLGKRPDTTTLRKNEFWALKDVNFDLRRGQALGLMGENGAGKSTLLRLIAGIFPPDEGEIMVKGRMGVLISLGAGFHPHMTGRENIYLNGTILGMDRDEIEAAFDDIVNFAEIGEFLDAPVSTYSSGMKIRLGFSIATSIQPDVLLLDEVLAVGDIGFRTRCYHRIGKIVSNSAVIFVSHSVDQVGRMCDSMLLLDKGKVTYQGDVYNGLLRYMSSFKKLDSKMGELFNFHPDVKVNEIILEPQKINSGDRLLVRVRYESKRDLPIGSLRCNFKNRADGLVADYASDYMGHEFYLLAGQHELVADMGEIRLATGEYVFNIAAFDETKQVALFHAHTIATLYVQGRLPTSAVMEMG